MSAGKISNAERLRLDEQRSGKADWRLWGPYLSEHAWGTVREDYSPDGTAWEHFDHEQSRSRAYRWSEDGLGGICDTEQRLCLALALWNGRDPFLKERAFGLTGNQGNHGEDVKECYFYLDATPAHSYLHYRYKYPQGEFPYQKLLEENAHRGRGQPPYPLADTGVFDGGRYFDVDVIYAKADPTTLHCRIRVVNRGPDAATLHLLPTLWFRNTWSWEDGATRPLLKKTVPSQGATWVVEAEHSTLGRYFLYGAGDARLLFTENDSNAERLWGLSNAQPYVKDAFHRFLVEGDKGVVNPRQTGTKFAAWHTLALAPGTEAIVDLLLTAQATDQPFRKADEVFAQRRSEADVFYRGLLADEVPAEDRRILRQALAGLIWNQQYYHFDVARWQDGDRMPPPESRKTGRNRYWRHLKAHDVISMPDCWEYPWFAAWDLAYQAMVYCLIDPDFAKRQIELLLNERYLHPNGHVPAYEWAFGDANPPLHAAAALGVFRTERQRRGKADYDFLQRVLNKLLLNYAWWLNRKDSRHHDLFEGGFLGLDNISVYDRSKPLPLGYALKQADATGWMAMLALNMTMMAVELAAAGREYEDIAVQCYTQFLAIAKASAGHNGHGISLWDTEDKFFKDLILTPEGGWRRLNVYSWVGIIPLFACEIVDADLLARVPRFRALLYEHRGGMFDGHTICACPEHTNEHGEHLLSLVNHTMLPGILRHLLDEKEFLSPYGIRSLSRIHAERRDLGALPGIGEALIEYVPGESGSALFGGNSNWRGPVWFPTNYSLTEALEKFHRYLGDEFKVTAPALAPQPITLREVSRHLSERLAGLFRRNAQGRISALPADSPHQNDEHWRELLLFHEYFHGDTGEGLGAAHQTGWTALVANLIMKLHANQG